MSDGDAQYSGTPDCRVTFAARTPSAAWETLTLPTNPPRPIWVWFKPSHVPNAVMIQIPPEAAGTVVPAVTVRYLTQCLGLDPVCVPMCSLFGFSFPGQGGMSPYFEQAVTVPPAGADPNIVIYVEAPAMQVGAPHASSSSDEYDEITEDQIEEMFQSMERDWKSSVQAERQLAGLQKQLVDQQTRLGTLNRDLSPDERVYAERTDIDDWQEARRALRDAAARLARYIKELSAGETVYAGKKRWFQQIHRNYVVRREVFDGMAEARLEFEVFRSTMQNLATRMQSASHHARQDGEIRAQQVLSRIATKVSAAKSKR